MGPAKGTRVVNKAVIKGYVDRQQPEDPHNSSKSKQKKRKIADLDPKWSKDELTHFYEAYRQHGKDWKKISLAVGSKSSDMVQSLYSVHRDESTSHRGVDQTVRASGKARKRGHTTEQKANEWADQHHSFHDRTISGFSSSFKKRYYGELMRKNQIHTVGRRTPRTPVTVPAQRNATDDDKPKFENVNNSTKNTAEETNNVCTTFPMGEFSPTGSSGITEANKADQGQAFLDSKGAEDADIYHSQHLKKRKFQQTVDEKVQTGKVEHETMMAAKEGIRLAAGSLDQQQTLSDFISEDDMLVLDVLQSLVNAPSKTSKLKINLPSGSLGKTYSALSHRLEEDHSPIDLPKQAKPVGNCSAPKTRQKRDRKILDAEVPGKDQNISVVSLVQPDAHMVGITEVSSCSDSKGVMPETSVNTSAEVASSAPSETKPEIRMSRRTKRKLEMHCKIKYVPCKITEGSENLQARKLQHCLSSESLRRWCTYEWFHSAVDYPWFSNNEFVSYLNHANLCHIPRLTRFEWSTVRSSLGKPRRFSDQLLAMEKEKLEDYRKSVRKIYAELSDGSRDSLPADLARPFSIGQQVIVRHPSSRELCDGKVVMMGRDFYKVDFSNPDLGVNIVKFTVNSERPPNRHTYDDAVLHRGCPDNKFDQNNELESYVTSFIQLSLSQARQIVDKAMQANSNDEVVGTSNQTTDFVGQESEAAIPDARLPSNLISNCIATVISIKRLSDSRHPPASIAGVLERASLMLRPSCPENLAIYKDIESYLSIIANQILALVPTTLGSDPALSPM
ncbi:hypothetical protein PR202_gb20636 [Eleusine coracana subsp. coracana]|uniref:SANT domain-containing protein n=1 Tax=Eleusine coracana subsp. coracana TaxID=191504 RepID=A0AAV5FB51_ELECO|nr:hypothetical protein PR202_gb20636 [Eleusine coracana subsp. coracana]